MKLMFAIGCSLLVCHAFAGEVKLKVSGPDGLDGTATIINKILEDGSKYVQLTMRLKYSDGQVSDVIQESSYDKNGEPVRMLQSTKAGSKKTSIVVTFSAEGAQVVSDKGDGPKTNMVVRPTTGSTANPTEFWFARTQPKIGETAEYFTFRVSDQTWIKAKSRFEGQKEVVVDGKRVMGNLVQMGEIKSYSDAVGDPYRIELGKLVLERVSK